MSYKKNRDELIDEMLDNYGHLFCESCSSSHAFKFHMHHLIFRSEKPGHKYLHDKKNLLLVCDKCHDLFHSIKSYRNEIVEIRELQKLFGNDILNK